MKSDYMDLLSRQHKALKTAAKRKADAMPKKSSKPVKLSAENERQYQRWWNSDPAVQKWKKGLADQYYRGNTKLVSDDPKLTDYDYRKAFMSGERPKMHHDGTYHWSSVGKLGGHKTMWKELYMQRSRQDPDVVEAVTSRFRRKK